MRVCVCVRTNGENNVTRIRNECTRFVPLRDKQGSIWISLLILSSENLGSMNYYLKEVYRGVIFGVLQVTTVPDEGENSFKMPRASVVHMTSTATRPQHMSQVSTHASSRVDLITDYSKLLVKFFLVPRYFSIPSLFRLEKSWRERGAEISWRPRRAYRRAHFVNLHFFPSSFLE